MSIIIKNERVTESVYLMKVGGCFKGEMGQFYMIKADTNGSLLSRPISIHDIDEEGISFLYKVEGRGTKCFKHKRIGDEITITGPYGNGYPELKGKKVALVGGGIGIAPLYYTAKKLSEDNELDIYLGFSDEKYETEKYEEFGNVLVDVGGIITKKVTFEKYDAVLSCGPEIMQKFLVEEGKIQESDADVYVSLENHMACAIGACLVCTCKTKQGNKKVCKDGPVFLGKDVIFSE